MKEAQVPPKRRFLQEPHGVTTQKTPFFTLICLSIGITNWGEEECAWFAGRKKRGKEKTRKTKN
jgi:hypothetical protein